MMATSAYPSDFFLWQQVMYARVWPLVAVTDNNGRPCWVVELGMSMNILPMISCTQLSNYFVGYILVKECQIYTIYVASVSFLSVLLANDSHTDSCKTPDSNIEAWQEPLINPWQDRANGKHVLSMPFWLYCYDTSGNHSKKCNEHNIFLMLPAGLPMEYAHSEANIQFLCTSNAALPLEMLDGIVTEFE